jgi:streptogramin lyase
LLTLSATAPAEIQVAELAGRVVDINGRPVARAMATLNRGSSPGPGVVTVFSGDDGYFEFPADAMPVAAEGELQVTRLGFESVDAPLRRPKSSGSSVVVLPRTANLATSAPASAWLAGIPESAAKDLARLTCTQCHQFPAPRVRDYAASLTLVPGAERIENAARADWEHTVRREGWRSMMTYMRARTYDLFPQGTAMDLRNIPWESVIDPGLGLFNLEDEAAIVGLLADHMPLQYAHLSDYDGGDPPHAAGAGAAIYEYRLPSASLVREVAAVKGSPYLWGADVEQNRLLKLDPVTGRQSWIPVPYPKASGPHTILGDPDGRIWISMIENDLLTRFDPASEAWEVWKLNEGTNVFGGEAIVHDIAFDHSHRVARDHLGRVWLTLSGANELGAFDPETAEVARYPAPAVPGRSSMNVTIYGAVMSADGGCVWFSQLNGFVGCFNTHTLEAESLIEFSRGSGPRRMAIDENDVLWIPLFGAGRLVKYDAAARRMLAQYDLPDRSAAPYALTWDSRRRVLWVANSNLDALYRFDPSTERFSILPLPRQQSYLRQLALHPETNDLLITYANIPAGSGPSMAVVVKPGG